MTTVPGGTRSSLRGWTGGLLGAVWALALLAGCPATKGIALDPTLPESVGTVTAGDPQAVVAAAAGSLEPAHRARALALAIRGAPAAEALAWVKRGLYDPDEWPAVSAVKATVARGGHEAELRALVAWPSAPTQARVRAALALPPEPALGSTLAATARTPLSQEDKALWWLAAAHHGEAGAVAELASALSTGHVGLDLGFMALLGEWSLARPAGDRQALAQALDGAAAVVEEELIPACLAAAAALGSQKAQGAVKGRLGGGEPLDELELIDRLASAPGPEALALLTVARRTASKGSRETAALWLAERQGDDGALLKGLASKDPEIRYQAARGLAALAPASKRPDLGAKLTAALVDADPVLRVSLTRALGELPGGDAVLKGLLADEDPGVQLEAAGALWRRASGGR